MTKKSKKGATKRKVSTKIQIPWRKPLAYFLGVIAFSLTIFLVKQVSWLKIDQVLVQGDFIYQDRLQFEQKTLGIKGQSLFNTELKELKLQLESLPWVNSVALSFSWPDTININYIEHHPVAFWNDDKLLNQFGDVLPAVSTKLELPRLQGPKDRERMIMERFTFINERFIELGLQIIKLEYIAYGSWHIELNNKTNLYLTNKNFNQEFERVIKWIDHNRQMKVATIDARYPHGVAVSFLQGADELNAVNEVVQ